MSYNPERYSTRSSGVSNTAPSYSYGPPGVVAESQVASTDSIYARMKRSYSESLYHPTFLGSNNTIGQNEARYLTNTSAKNPRYENTSHLPIYPQRPGEKDCAYYMQTRTCKFGDICMFDHPIWVPEGGYPDWKEVLPEPSESLPERPGVPDCPFFLRTQRCKYGNKCKFNHPKDRTAPTGGTDDVDSSALPERPTEPPCAFYMKTGQCKYGVTCKFNHPKNAHTPSTEQDNGTVVQNKLTEDVKPVHQLFSPALLHNTKGLPIRLGEVDCPFYLKTGSCKYGVTCRYNHPERLAINPLAAAISPTIVPAASLLPNFSPMLTQTMLGMSTTIYPQRPGQMECEYYIKTGECKYASTCKFHHPIDRSATAKHTFSSLPRIQGAIQCPYYMKTGSCKYGSTCKFDHPPPAEVMGMATSSANQ